MQEAYGRADPSAEQASDAPGSPSGMPDAPSLPMDPADPDGRSEHADTCPFLRADRAGVMASPIEAPDPANRCVAVGAPAPQSARQQELVCLTAGHANCPRYLRGALVPRQRIAAASIQRGPSTPVIASALTLVLAAAASVGFLLVRGGLGMPVASGAPVVAVVSQAPATAGPPARSPTPTATQPPSPSPAPTPTPTPTPAPTAPPTSTPAATPRPAPTSNRYAVLDPCPGQRNCWIYTVRPGDNLRSIANWFGIPYETVLDWNPHITDPATIRAGDEIRMPPPTR